jgi:hypothetical protein
MNDNKEIAKAIRKRIIDLQSRGALTSLGEPISLAAIARTMRDEKHTNGRNRTLMYLVLDGKCESRPAKEAIHRELDAVYWTLPPKENKK